MDASDDSLSAATTTQLPSIETTKGRKGGGSYIHRNSKLKRSSPYALLGNTRQEIHLSLPNTTEKVLHRHTPSDQSCGNEIYSSDKPYSERASREEDLNNLPPPPPIMNRPINIIIWNIRGASNEGAIRNLRDIINNYNPIVLALLETRQEDHSRLRDTFKFTGMMEQPIVGRSSGIVLLWHDNVVVVTNVRQSSQELHAIVKVSHHTTPWLLSVIYASTNYN